MEGENRIISHAFITEASKIIKLQDMLMSTMNSTLLVYDWILKSSFSKDEAGLYDLFFTTISILRVRPRLIDYLAELYSLLFSQSSVQSYLKDHRQIVLHYFFSPLICSLDISTQNLCLHFLRRLFHNRLFSISDIITEIKSISNSHGIEEENFLLHVFFWFAPDFDSSHIGSDILTRILPKSHFDYSSSHSLLHTLQSQIHELSSNNWQLLNQYITLGMPPEKAFIYAKYDDLDKFVSIASEPDFNINQRLPSSLFTDGSMVAHNPYLIQFAAFYGSSRVFKYLMIHGAKINVYDNAQFSTAQFAVAGGNLEIIRLLFNSGVSFLSTLPVAASFLHYELFLWIYYSFKPDINSIDPKFSSILHQCASSANFRTLIFLFQTTNCNVNIRNEIDLTPLHFAVQNNQILITKILLEHPLIKVNCKNSSSQTPLYIAAMHGYIKIIEMLKKKPGIDPNIRAIDGTTALHQAASNGHANVIQSLFTFPGIEINYKCLNNLTPLHIAAMRGHLQCVKLLCSHEGIEMNARDKDGKSPLMIAIQYDQIEVVKWMIGIRGVNINHQDEDGNTALHCAVILKNSKMVQLLISNPHININSQNKSSATPIFIAVSQGKADIVKLLLDTNKVQLNMKIQQKTVCEFAYDKMNEAVIQAIKNYNHH